MDRCDSGQSLHEIKGNEETSLQRGRRREGQEEEGRQDGDSRRAGLAPFPTMGIPSPDTTTTFSPSSSLSNKSPP